MLRELFLDLTGPHLVLQGLAGGIVIATLNLLGALIVVAWRNPSRRLLDGALGFAAGVMLSASFTSLILPGIEHGGILPVIVGIALGVIVLDQADRWVPHIHVMITGRVRQDVGDRSRGAQNGPAVANQSPAAAENPGRTGHDALAEPVRGSPADGASSLSEPRTVATERRSAATQPGVVAAEPEAATAAAVAAEPDRRAAAVPGQPNRSRIASVLLFIVAVTLHNLPEGLAVGVSFGSGNLDEALALMLAIGLQNIPEGLAVSVAALNAGFNQRFYAALTGIRAGLVEVPLAVFGAWAVTLAQPILPYAMGFAAGGMLYVISDEIIPETHGRGNERIATWGTMLGAVVMLYLDVVLG